MSRVWTKKPPRHQAILDPNFKYRGNIIACWMFDEVHGLMRDISGNGYDAQSGNNAAGTFTASDTTGPAATINKNGKAAKFDGVQDCYEVTSSLASNDRMQKSCSFLFTCMNTGVTDSDQRIIDKSTAGSATNGWAIEMHKTNDFLQFYRGGALQNFLANNAFVNNTDHIFCLTTPEDGITMQAEAFRDGMNVRDFASIGVDEDFSSFNTTTTGVRIGTWNHTDGREWQGDMGLLVLFDNRIDDEDARSLSLNPWQIFKPKPQFALLAPQHELIEPAKRVWTRQPPAGTPIDWNNPLAKGIIHAAYQSGSIDLQNYAQSGNLIAGGTPLITAGVNGLAFDSAAGYATTGVNNAAIFNFDNPHSLFSLATIPDNVNSSQEQTILGIESSSSNRYTGLAYRSNTATDGNRYFRYYFRQTGPAVLYLDASGNNGYSFGSRIAIGAVKHTSTDRRLYLQGELVVSNTTSHSGSVLSDEISIGQARSNGSNGMQGASDLYRGTISLTIVWDRGLSDTDMASFSENPWQIFKYPDIQIPKDIVGPPIAIVEKSW